jgi:hypothetical protein
MTNWWDKPEVHDEYERRYRQLNIVPVPEPTEENPALWDIDLEAFNPQRKKGDPN